LKHKFTSSLTLSVSKEVEAGLYKGSTQAGVKLKIRERSEVFCPNLIPGNFNIRELK